MSYDVYIEDANGIINLDHKHQIHGGTYAIGGRTELQMNVTFNYSAVYSDYLNASLRDLDGMTVKRTIPTLCTWIAKLAGAGGEPSDDYWEPSVGNARVALANLLSLCHLAPLTATLRVEA